MIVDLLVEIQKASDPANHFASMVGYQSYWTEFAFDWDSMIQSSNGPERETYFQAWINMNIFCAKISE
ncbi:hypothetical protein E4U17_001048 [Claviceps sp. LM77 group G4]|nr:hypothetical protein E4U17_001048 [Claviceps sp. LM77 group G4]